MAPSRLSLKRSLLLSTFFALSLFSAGGLAADPPSSSQAQAPTQKQTTTQGGGKNQPTSATSNNPPVIQTTTANNGKTATITPTGNAPTTNGPGTLPTISGTTAPAQTGKLTDLPTLPSTADQSIPTYPAPAVPPTQNAPFMQYSTLPEGTVFICVGAILGAFGAAVLVWRGIVACLLHRSVERAAMAQHAANDKAAFPAPPAPFYKYSDRDSSPSLGAIGRGQRRTQRGPTPSATPSQTNLFFSPTAPGAGGFGGPSNRDSRFLPSGFYAAGSASPANGHGHSISLSNLRPDSRGHARAVEPSPPGSPAFGPRSTPVPRNMSSSSVSLNRPPSGRAPSAFLDDLLDDQPHLFPPAGPSHQRTYSHSSQGRYN